MTCGSDLDASTLNYFLTAVKNINSTNCWAFGVEALAADHQLECGLCLNQPLHSSHLLRPVMYSGAQPGSRPSITIKSLLCCVMPPVTQQATASWLHISCRKPRLHQRYVTVGKHCCWVQGSLRPLCSAHSLKEALRGNLWLWWRSGSQESHCDRRINDLLPALSLCRRLSQLVVAHSLTRLSVSRTVAVHIEPCYQSVMDSAGHLVPMQYTSWCFHTSLLFFFFLLVFVVVVGAAAVPCFRCHVGSRFLPHSVLSGNQTPTVGNQKHRWKWSPFKKSP